MKPLAVLSLFLWLAGLTPAQTINGVANVAFSRNSVLAPGGMFYVFGSNLGPANAFRVPPPYTNSLGPYSMVLRAGADGPETAMIMVSVQSTGAVAIVPSSVAEGDYELIFVAGPARSRAIPVRVAKRSLSFFAQAGNGTGPATAIAAGRAISFTAPVRPGDLVTILATGLGATTGADNRADPRPIDAEVELLVGKKLMKASSQGRSTADAGLDEVRFIMPEDAEVGESCYLPVRARMDGVWSNIVTIAKANTASACAHPLGVDETVLRKLSAGQGLVLGNFNLIRRTVDIDLPGKQEATKRLEAIGRFWVGDGAALLDANGRLETTGLGEGECFTDALAVTSTSKITPEEVILNLATSRSTLRNASALDGGGRAVLTAPSALRVELTVNPADGILYAAPPETDLAGALVPGDWELETAGGSQLAGGKVTLKLEEPEPIVWDQALGVIDASEALPLQWTVKGAPEAVRTFVFGIFAAPVDETTVSIGTFNCAQTAPGQFTVPQSVMQRMPRAEAGRAYVTVYGYGARAPFTVDYRNLLGRSDYAAFAQEIQVSKVREYKR